MNEALIRRVMRAYQLKPLKILPPQTGYRNQSWPVELAGNHTVNFIVYKHEPHITERILRANSVADYAAEHGLPTRQTLSPRIIRLSTSTTTRYGALYTYLPGRTIPWEAYTKTHIKLLGMALGTLHHVLSRYNRPLPHVADEYIQLIARMRRYFADPGVQQAMRAKLGLRVQCNYQQITEVLTRSKQLKKQQPLHMDFVRGNILFDTNNGQPLGLGDVALTGIIDFEKVAYGHAQFDVARTLAFLLVDCKYKNQHEVRKYFLHSGYRKRGKQQLQSIAVKAGTARPLLEVLVDLFLLHDFYKFLRHNPYEFLHQNEHFVRTKNILHTRGLIIAN